MELPRYSERHRFPGYLDMLKHFQAGSILEAMTRFYLASQKYGLAQRDAIVAGEVDFEITPHIIDQLLHTLSRLATSPQKYWVGFEQTTRRENFWVPPNVGKNENIRRMSVPILSLHAIGAIYDIAGSFEIRPSISSMSAMLHALSKHSNEETYTKCVAMMLLRLAGSTFHESVVTALTSFSLPIDSTGFQATPPVLIRAIVEGYGRLGEPQIGESLLRRWASEGVERNPHDDLEYRVELENLWRSATDGKQKSVAAPVWIDSSKWARHTLMWCTLIRSRAHSHDLAGARHWFHRYRREGLVAVRSSMMQNCGAPHLEYLLACTKIRRRDVDNMEEGIEKVERDGWIEKGKTRYTAVLDVVKLMYRDGATLSSRAFVLLLNFQLGYGKIQDAIGMVSAFLSSKEGLAAWPPNFYVSLFHLNRLIYTRPSTVRSDLMVKKHVDGRVNFIDLRSTYRDFVRHVGFRTKGWTVKERGKGLEAALHASLAAEDIPLVLAILLQFREADLSLDENAQIFFISNMFPSQYKIAEKQQRRNAHAWKLHENMRSLLQENTPEGEIQRLVLTAKYSTTTSDEEIDANAERFIRYATTKICNRLRRLMRRRKAPSEKDARWLHDAYAAFRGRDFVSKGFNGDDIVPDEEIITTVLAQVASHQIARAEGWSV
ncbi:hypothetical protein CBS101457_001892 [Exobasidium rhododendri]|nr:hypothetical protein CBS101457_001892 [Exobasidium rhododendri]